MIVVVESPYSGDVPAHMTYIHRAIRDSLDRGESPVASHVMYTTALNDANNKERARGIQAGLRFYQVAKKCVVYGDYGLSEGMLHGISAAKVLNVPVEVRLIGQNP